MSGLQRLKNDVGVLAKAAVEGYMVGGPPGGIMGVASEVVKRGISDLMGDSPAAGPAAGGLQQPAITQNGCSQGLTTDGQSCVDTGRYLITFKDREARIFDKQNSTYLRAWGDPHLATGDGDKAQFHENLSIDLADGTKVTFKVTEKNAKGVAHIDSAAIMKGMQAIVVSGLSDDQPGFQVGNVLNNADAVDAAWADGTVLRAGQQVDDLTFASDGKEILGTDTSQKFNEHLLDGKGGTSINRPDAYRQTAGAGGAVEGGSGVNGSSGANAGSGVSGSSGIGGGSLYDLMWSIINRLEGSIRNVAENVDALSKEFDNQQKLKNANDGKLPGDYQLPENLRQFVGGEGTEISETSLKKAFSDLQRLNEMISQLTGTMSNMQKADHDAKMNIVQNLK